MRWFLTCSMSPFLMPMLTTPITRGAAGAMAAAALAPRMQCVNVWMCVCACTRVFVHVCVCVCMFERVRACVCARACARASTCVCTCLHMLICSRYTLFLCRWETAWDVAGMQAMLNAVRAAGANKYVCICTHCALKRVCICTHCAMKRVCICTHCALNRVFVYVRIVLWTVCFYITNHHVKWVVIFSWEKKQKG